ncbi:MULTISPECIES: phosphate signaling complex protein PhoU [Thermomonospora]|uniref:Phosphate-specific transport system accessory protein PhoU n=1 Tax=Thermomonospora curvata (strain ATCC 19995 / DSM 43183 / JCM 3096 / KCTC 9072 / NBRC 15933 / NCIMB 10081 / Henssen B9) TaxID=471852 RepID=D1A4Q6_THECD|nr:MULTISPECIES: phosphate signaling complex protein PhoU [Thermomonospora]ACY96291.1 phosphate uptake regulator, PhoU [Thermomonospora curvata DSM 43183]PKK15709.1 MAG: phosphate transport system regulatory protein PhoU [Thermomonospora sp. CIF 1]
MRDVYHEELDGISDKLVEMTRLVRSAMTRATTALLDADLPLAEQVISGDEQINQLDAEIEETVFDLMARQQPVAGDLRTLITSLRMSGDLERMGDLAVHLAKTARRRHPDPAVPPQVSVIVLEMGHVAERMAAKAGSVIASRDVAMALELDGDDDAMDRLHRKLFDVLLSPKWRHGVEPAVDITLAGRYFERFADHAVHVAENMVYLVTGQRPEEIA